MSETADRIGFLTCTEFEGWGLCGGLLLLNQLARPLEFHCTLPVKVSRTQAILFGKGLRSHVCGQVIGKALVEKPKTPPHVVVTDCPHTATVHRECRVPVVYLPPAQVGQVIGEPPEMADHPSPWQAVDLGSLTMHIAGADPDPAGFSLDSLGHLLRQFTAQHDLAEPLERVRQAISEARDAASRAA